MIWRTEYGNQNIFDFAVCIKCDFISWYDYLLALYDFKFLKTDRVSYHKLYWDSTGNFCTLGREDTLGCEESPEHEAYAMWHNNLKIKTLCAYVRANISIFCTSKK